MSQLVIDMHSYNALAAGDVYGRAYNKEGFYTNSDAQSAFDQRLIHVVNHVHTTLGKPWKELSDYIFGFEAENEAMIGDVRASYQSLPTSILTHVLNRVRRSFKTTSNGTKL